MFVEKCADGTETEQELQRRYGCTLTAAAWLSAFETALCPVQVAITQQGSPVDVVSASSTSFIPDPNARNAGARASTADTFACSTTPTYDVRRLFRISEYSAPMLTSLRIVQITVRDAGQPCTASRAPSLCAISYSAPT